MDGEKVLPSSWQSAGSVTGNAGMVIGCVIAGPLISRIGRKKNTVLAIIAIALVGMLMQKVIPNYWGVMVGRMVNAISMVRQTQGQGQSQGQMISHRDSR